jgi:hypothetical protein
VRRAANRRPVACVYGWGCCSDGRIGPGREDSCERPAEIESITLMLRQIKRKPISVAAGGAHSLAVLDVTREVYSVHFLYLICIHIRVLDASAIVLHAERSLAREHSAAYYNRCARSRLLSCVRYGHKSLTDVKSTCKFFDNFR